MKRLLGGLFIVLFVLSSCNNKKMKNPFSFSFMMNDSVKKHIEDSLALLAREPMRTEADELFNDFIYNFASDDNLQKKRIVFPLSVYRENKRYYIDKEHWRHNSFFVKQKFYTLLFDKEKDMDLANDTALKSVQVEWLCPKTKMVQKYAFKRVKGVWLLEAIYFNHMTSNGDESFLDFYHHFVTDSLFQSRRVCQPLSFLTTNPDDDFSLINATIDVNQWFAFKPQLPVDRLSNINYGQQNSDKSNHKIVALKGVGNGFSNVLYFVKKAGKWKLYKFEDTSI